MTMSSRILIANIDSHLPFTIYESTRVIGVLISHTLWVLRLILYEVIFLKIKRITSSPTANDELF